MRGRQTEGKRDADFVSPRPILVLSVSFLLLLAFGSLVAASSHRSGDPFAVYSADATSTVPLEEDEFLGSRDTRSLVVFLILGFLSFLAGFGARDALSKRKRKSLPTSSPIGHAERKV